MQTILLLTMLATLTAQAQTTFKVQDASGAGLKDELVIVQDLNGPECEISRSLTDKDGNVSALDLKPGLYRMIATDPYGSWQTQVREFLVRSKPSVIVASVQPMPTQGNGDIVTLPGSWVTLRVTTWDGIPAHGAKILIRDEDATRYLERWYVANEDGVARIAYLKDRLFAVVIYQDVLITQEITAGQMSPVIVLPRS